jgi:hypothetical protein
MIQRGRQQSPINLVNGPGLHLGRHETDGGGTR